MKYTISILLPEDPVMRKGEIEANKEINKTLMETKKSTVLWPGVKSMDIKSYGNGKRDRRPCQNIT